MPLVSQTFDQLLDFTRTSAATFVGSNGLIQTTPASRNLLTWTQQFDNAVWNKEASTATANATTAPDGTSTADKVAATATTAFHSVRQFITGTVASYTYSVYAKASEYSKLILANATAGTWSATFDLATGATIATGGTAVLSSSIQSVGDGWYRCAVTFTGAAASTAHAAVGYPNTGATLNNFGAQYTGDGTSGIFLWGAQLEAVPDANLVLGSELRGTGTVGLVGTATAASYNTGTGAGAVTRVDASNQSYVEFTGLTNAQVYRVVVSCGTGSLSVRGGLYTDSVVATLTAGQSVTVYVTASSNRITVTNAPVAGSSTFTLTSIREYLGVTGMPSTYTRNNGGVFPPRFDYDPVTLAAKGLLIEEQRTNLLVRSAEFDNAGSWAKSNVTVTANVAISPDGAADADLLLPDTATGSHQVAGSATTTATATTFSVYAKANGYNFIALGISDSAAVTRITYFNVSTGAVGTVATGITASITPVGNGWYRCVATVGTALAGSNTCRIYATNADGVTSFTGNGTSGIFLWGAQLEAGSFATSYIPTVASQVTRTADQCSIVAPNFAPWYNQSEGTVVSEFSSFSPTSASNAAWTISDETNSNRWFAFAVSSTIRHFMATGGVTQASIDVGTYAANTVFKSAMAISANSVQAAVNGTLGTEDTTATVPTVVRLTVGSSPIATTNFLNGHVRSIRYYPTRLTNAQLQALTA